MPTSGKTGNLDQRMAELADEVYADFTSKLIPGLPRESVMGVRAPQLKQLAKEIRADDPFLDALPHRWHDQNMLHAYVLCNIKDFDTALAATERFLPYVTNWAVCDSLSPMAFAKNADRLTREVKKVQWTFDNVKKVQWTFDSVAKRNGEQERNGEQKKSKSKIEQWLSDGHEYTVRFGISMLLKHFLGSRFDKAYLQRVARIDRSEYYIRMMQAWYIATALAKQWDATLDLLRHSPPDEWVYRKSIQKALESYRITPEQKKLLRSLRLDTEKKGRTSERCDLA